jgi:NAD dependent epimerase/dehydratase family enzyme
LPGRISSESIIERFGPVRAQYLLQTTKVLPQRALDTGFQFRFNTLQDAIDDMASPVWWRSELDKDKVERNFN